LWDKLRLLAGIESLLALMVKVNENDDENENEN
jgi:hypothetical protein